MNLTTVSDAPAVHIENALPTIGNQFPTPINNPTTPTRKRPTRTLGLVGTNAAFLVPDFIRKRFSEGWNVHVPLTFLTDKGCLLKDKAAANSSLDILTIDNTSGRILASAKPLSDEGEMDLTFDEWHQAWRRLLELIKTFLPDEFLLWEVHYSFILLNENRAEMWPVYLAYDIEIRKRATQLSIDPSQFSIGIWNDLEARYTAKKVYSLVQSDLKQYTNNYSPRFQQSNQQSRDSNQTPRNSNRTSSFRSYNQRGQQQDNHSARCIFCGDRTKSHISRNCSVTSNVNGNPCHLIKQGSSGNRQNKAGKSYCYAWNGLSGCDQTSLCRRGEHWCTLCGSTFHNAQRCDIVT
jgi:hypothetical protein